jgi:glutathione peroxidase
VNRLFHCGIALAVGAALGSTASAADQADQQVPGVLKFKMKSLDGKEVDLARYQGKVLLIVNLASECGYTPQYKDLQALYSKYGKDGFVVLGFPCNQFGQQEPGTSKEIADFCKKNYGVTFPLFAKIDIEGPGAAPLYRYLTSREHNSKFAGPVKWNFEKYLISRTGEVIARFEAETEPASASVVEAIENELKKK